MDRRAGRHRRHRPRHRAVLTPRGAGGLARRSSPTRPSPRAACTVSICRRKCRPAGRVGKCRHSRAASAGRECRPGRDLSTRCLRRRRERTESMSCTLSANSNRTAAERVRARRKNVLNGHFLRSGLDRGHVSTHIDYMRRVGGAGVYRVRTEPFPRVMVGEGRPSTFCFDSSALKKLVDGPGPVTRSRSGSRSPSRWLRRTPYRTPLRGNKRPYSPEPGTYRRSRSSDRSPYTAC